MNMGVKQYFTNIRNATVSTLEGMAVTMSWMFRRPYTIQWPDKIDKPLEETLPETTRGLLEVETKLCTGCLACETACPINCITIETERNTETKERFITRFDIDAAKCMYCGLCVEACRTDAIRHTTNFAAANDNIANLIFHFVSKGERFVPAKPKELPTDLPLRGTIIRSMVKECSFQKNRRHERSC
jgi:NAD(P)H-quinone oxidoreductase subunit I